MVIIFIIVKILCWKYHDPHTLRSWWCCSSNHHIIIILVVIHRWKCDLGDLIGMWSGWRPNWKSKLAAGQQSQLYIGTLTLDPAFTDSFCFEIKWHSFLQAAEIWYLSFCWRQQLPLFGNKYNIGIIREALCRSGKLWVAKLRPPNFSTPPTPR